MTCCPSRSPRPWPAQAILAAIGGTLLEILFLVLRRFGDLETHVVELIAAGLAAGVLYFILIYALEHTADSRAGFWLIFAAAVVFRLTLASLPPTLSEDLYRYRWDGRVQLAGWNPYQLRPDDPRLAALRAGELHRFPAPDLPTIYPPLAELFFRWDARWFRGILPFKQPIVAADLLVLALLAWWLRSAGARHYQFAIYAWHPLVVVELSGSGHYDALVLLALVAAFVMMRWRKRLATLLLAAAALIKTFPIVLLPAMLRRNGWPRDARSWAELFSAGALAAACWWPFRSAWGQLHSTEASYESRWLGNNASLYSVLKYLSGSHELAAGIGAGVVLGLAIWAAARCKQGLPGSRAAFLLIGAILMFAPNAYSWYFTWIIPFLCFYPSAAWLLLTVTQFLSYHVLIEYQALDRWHFSPAMLWLTYGPFYALFLWQSLQRIRKSSC